jgi:putative two-component system response regulator
MTQAWTPSEGQAGPPVLIVGDSVEARSVHRLLVREGVRALSVPDPGDATRALDASGASVIVLDIDVAHDDAVGLCHHVKRNSATRLIPIVLLSDDRQKEHRLGGIEAGAEALLTKPFDPDELLARVRVASRVSQYTSDLDSAASIVMTVTAMIEARESSPGHCYRMANYATALGRALQLGEADLKALYRGAFLHDIGMLSIPDGILRKGGRLEPEEYEIIKSHPVIGDALCANLRTLHSVRPIVRHHHERLDGSGYPDGLEGDDLPLLPQIVSIVDLFEAITMGREYVAPRSAAEALEVLRHEVHVGWRRPDLVEPFATLVQGGALERFRGEVSESPIGLDDLASDLKRAADDVAGPAVVAAWGSQH